MKKTIFITGAGSGIGRDSAIALATRGHDVIATCETEEQVQELAEYATNLGVSLNIFKLDIREDSDRALIDDYDIDVLINVAGIGETGSLADVPLERVRANFETNVFGTLAVIQLALKKMMQKKRGTILVVGSVAGRIPTPFMGPCSMTKYALSGGIAALRTEIHSVAPDVHISLIEPGAYATGFNQRMFATKYVWMDKSSYFWDRIQQLKHKDEQFKRVEEKSTKSIVRKIIQASEAQKPRLRYVAPVYQGLYVWLRRMLGA